MLKKWLGENHEFRATAVPFSWFYPDSPAGWIAVCPMIFLSLGAGVQSTVMLMLGIRGEIDRPDHVIFADTGWEPAGVYKHVEWCKRQCEKAGIPFHQVANGNIRDDMVTARTADSGEYSGRWASMPVFVDTGSGVEGQIRRQCTSEYKLAPLRAKQRELLGYKLRQRIPANSCQVMIGISTDEARRASPSSDKWVDNLYPLIDPLKMSRNDCQSWWEQHYPHVPLTKSSCIGCPFKSDVAWKHMKDSQPEEFEDAVQFDHAIRNAAGKRGQCYLHRSLKPLAFVNLNDSQIGLDLDDGVYCAGGCGL